MNDNIKPCPKCGSKNRVDTAPHKIVWCASCGAIFLPQMWKYPRNRSSSTLVGAAEAGESDLQLQCRDS